MNKPPYDQKLREFAEEFRTLCKKYDVVGSALVVSKTHSEFMNVVESTWSVMKMEGMDQLRFRSRKEDFESKEKQHEATECTVHAITSLMNFGRQTEAAWASVLRNLEKHMTVFYSVWDKPDSVPGDGK